MSRTLPAMLATTLSLGGCAWIDVERSLYESLMITECARQGERWRTEECRGPELGAYRKARERSLNRERGKEQPWEKGWTQPDIPATETPAAPETDAPPP